MHVYVWIIQCYVKSLAVHERTLSPLLLPFPVPFLHNFLLNLTISYPHDRYAYKIFYNLTPIDQNAGACAVVGGANG